MPATQTTASLLDLAWPDGRRERLRLADKAFAEGADARLFAVRGRPELVAKMYREPSADPRRRAKLDAMLADPPVGVATEHEGRRSVQVAWPVALVEAAGGDSVAPTDAPLGFVMPRVDLDRAVDLELLLSARGRRAAGLPEAYRTRAAVAHNLAAVVASLHAAGDHVIDLKPTNIHVHRGSFFVAMLDCDGFSIGPADGASTDDDANGARFPAHQYTDGYIAPEALRARARPEDLGEAQDRFALAVVLFRLLSGGYHPFQGVPRPGAPVPTTDSERVAAGLYPYHDDARDLTPPPGSLYAAFGPATRALFDAAFEGAAADRPSAEAWRRHLRGLLDGDLTPCPRNPDHARYGDRPCGLCASESAMRASARPRPAKPPKAAERRSSRFAAGKLTAFLVGLMLFIVVVMVGINVSMPEEDRILRAAGGDPDRALREAIQAGSPQRVRSAMGLGANASTGAYGGQPPEGGLYEPIDDAVGFPAAAQSVRRCFEVQDPEWFSYTHWAAYAHQLTLLEALLDGGAPLDVHDYEGRTPLMWAARNCGPTFALTPSATDALLGLGQRARPSGAQPAPTDTEGDGLAALIASVREVRDDLGLSDTLSEGALDVAALAQNAAVVDELLSRSPDLDAVDADGRTALAYAAASGNAATVRQLLRAGASPDAADVMGVTPLMAVADQAASPRSDEIAAAVVAELLAGGADPARRDRSGRTAADYVGERAATRRGKLDRERARAERQRLGRARSEDAGRPLPSLDTLRLDRSATLELLTSGGALEDALARPVAVPARGRADLGDGGSAVSRLRPETIPRETPPWTRSGSAEVACDPALAGPLRVTLVLERRGSEGDAHRNFDVPLWSPQWGRLPQREPGQPSTPLDAKKRQCLLRAQEAFTAWYDVSAEPERWPTETFTVRVVPE